MSGLVCACGERPNSKIEPEFTYMRVRLMGDSRTKIRLQKLTFDSKKADTRSGQGN